MATKKFTFREATAPHTGPVLAGAAIGSFPRWSGTRPLIGYGPMIGAPPEDVSGARRATWQDVLRIRALVIDDGKGKRVALVAADMWAGSLFVLESVGELVAQDPNLHLGRDAIFFSGTHTHCSPGGCYESPYYAEFSEPWPRDLGFNSVFTADLSLAVFNTIKAAVAHLKPAKLSVATGRFDWSINRSITAFVRNANSPPGIDYAAQRKAVNPALQLLILREAEENGLIGVWCPTNCHATAMGRNAEFCDPDFLGQAGKLLEQRHAGAIFAVCAGETGDTDPQPDITREQFIADRRDLSKARKGRDELATKLADAIDAALSGTNVTSADGPIVVRHSLVKIAGERVAPNKVMPRDPRVSKVVTAGSELGRGTGAKEGDKETNGNSQDPHYPMAGNLISWFASRAFRGAAASHSDYLSLTIIKFGQALMLVGLPGEPTTTFSARVAARLKEHEGQRVAICGVNGGYNGYFVTAEEFAMQHYEGASCIWGRHTEAFFLSRLPQLSKGGGPEVSLRKNGHVFSLDFDERNLDSNERAKERGYVFVQFKRLGSELFLRVPGLGRVDAIGMRAVDETSLVHFFLLPASYANTRVELVSTESRLGPGPSMLPLDDFKRLEPPEPFFERVESVIAKPVDKLDL